MDLSSSGKDARGGAVPGGDIDIWQLALHGSGVARRLNHFTEYEGYGANNSVISADGRKMAFGLRIKGGEHGNAAGILLYDLERARNSDSGQNRESRASARFPSR